MHFSEESSGRPPSRGGSEPDPELTPEQLAALALRFSRRDRRAFEEVFRLFREAVYVIGVLELGDVDEAQDLVQETFRRAWSSARTLSNPERLRPWLFSIARNLCVDLSKRARRRPVAVEEVPEGRLLEPDSQSPLRQAVQREQAQRVQELLRTVPAQFREILALRLLQEQSYQEIAGTLDLPLHGVKNAIARGGKLLVEKIRNSPGLVEEGEL